ncbi:MAG: hypothetical protein QNJ18_05350 [Xenococcaceae cyanobacterium MO_167.B52]|nr:hypothetical protein [Xenococcaceae cyanobacterium MO_167.B52]
MREIRQYIFLLVDALRVTLTHPTEIAIAVVVCDRFKVENPIYCDRLSCSTIAYLVGCVPFHNPHYPFNL